MIPASDQLMEDLYTFVNKAKDEPTRLELSRIALLAVQYRANQLKQQRTQRAIERVAAERRALKDSTGASRDMSSARDDDPLGVPSRPLHAR